MKFHERRTRDNFGTVMPALLSVTALAVAALFHDAPAWAQGPVVIGGTGTPNPPFTWLWDGTKWLPQWPRR